MKVVLGKLVPVIAVSAALLTSACASQEAVERAQATADNAQKTADSALPAVQAASNAHQAANTAQATGQAAQQGVDQNRSDIAALKGQVDMHDQQLKKGERD